ncbi:MAG: SPASM domain-containing protein [Treponema sp.]|nr:SPASM domain-containing protein [Treponema sp.]
MLTLSYGDSDYDVRFIYAHQNMKVYIDKRNKFIEKFDAPSGFYIRSGIIANGEDTGIDPFMRNFPQLIDVGIMGKCTHGLEGLCRKAGVQCYQNGEHIVRKNMSVDDFTLIARQCAGKVFQFALGGRGDPDQHEQLEEILCISRDYGIVPNFTTSGLRMTPEIAMLCKRYIGAVAVSWYRSRHTLDAIVILLQAGIKTNIHYVLGKNTIDEAIERLRARAFPSGINAVIFLLHKPVGLGEEANVLRYNDIKMKDFFKTVDDVEQPYKIGFDSCTVPGLVTMAKNIDFASTDYCEGARYSCYIDAQMNMMPCSFAVSAQTDANSHWSVNLRNHSIAEVWDSEPFERFRNHMRNSCPGCPDRLLCGGGCPIVNQITLCGRKERYYEN